MFSLVDLVGHELGQFTWQNESSSKRYLQSFLAQVFDKEAKSLYHLGQNHLASRATVSGIVINKLMVARAATLAA